MHKLGRLLLLGIVALRPFVAGADPPGPPQSAAAIQAWIFDGGYQSSALLGVSLTAHGMSAHGTYLGDYRCDDNSSPPPGGLLQVSASKVGVFLYSAALPLGFGPALDPLVLVPPAPPGPDPALTAPDCVALQNETAVHDQVVGLLADAGAVQSQVGACLQDVKRLVCDVNTALAQLVTFCQQNPDDCTGPPGGISCMSPSMETPSDSLLTDSPGPCSECAEALAELALGVDKVEYQLTRCAAARTELQAIRDAALFNATSSGDSLSRVAILTCAPPALPLPISKAESAWLQANAIVAGMPATAAACGHDSLTASCDLCGPEPRELPALLTSGQVTMRRDARQLGRLKGALQSAAATTADPALAARYSALAGRLGSLPDARVLEVSAPSPAPFSQEFVAVRPPGAPDDGHSPLAVVLTLVRTRGGDPTLNRADRDLLMSAFEAFKTTLAPGRPCPRCPPAP